MPKIQRLVKKLLTTFIFLFSLSFLAIASGDVISFRAFEVQAPQNLENYSDWAPEDRELVGNEFFRIIQFEQIPSQEQKEALEEKGVRFIYYQPYKAYYVGMQKEIHSKDLEGYGIRSLFKYEAAFKMTEHVVAGNIPSHAKLGNGKAEYIVSYLDDISEAQIESLLSKEGYEANEINDQGYAFTIGLDQAKLNDLLELPFIYYVDYVPAEGEPENNTARTLHRSSAIHPVSMGSNGYDGTGVVLQVQDNSPLSGGNAHIDHHGRLNTNFYSGPTSTHGAHVMGTVLGAGNLNPLAEGMASGAFAYKYGPGNANYNAVPNLVTNSGLVITQKSYSNGCNAGYTSLTRQLDQQVNDANQLLHVFSAGNSNGSNCGYGAGNQWGNVTGGHKIAKNAIATANVTELGNISGSSSRGPAWDGRIKPDLSAKGTQVLSTYPANTYATISGTSMAAPGIAGVSAQLYQAYRENNVQANPPGGLIKAIMQNTAEDLGNAGPDFIYGYGHVNALRSAEVIENSMFMIDTISQGDSLVYSINVPAGSQKLRVMLYWPDEAASVNANPSLVNDIDFLVYDPTATEYKPWVLNHAPNPTTLAQPAVRGDDHLNNMEQVTIDLPASGNYQLVAKGFSIPMGPQQFFITYYFEDDQIDVTYPRGGETMQPGESTVIRWDAYGLSGNFSIDISLDSGATWSPVSTSVPQARRYHSWIVPSTPTPYAFIRVNRGAVSGVSLYPFSIMAAPTNLQVTALCTDSAELTWASSGGATGYVVRKLGTQYMDSVGFTTGNSYWIPITPGNANEWFTVNAVGPGKSYSRRANAVQMPSGGVFNCPESPMADFTAVTDNICVGKTVQLFDASINVTTSWAWTISPGTFTYVNGTSANSQNPEVQFTASGSYDVSLTATNAQGSGSETKVSFITTIDGDPTPLEEYFTQFQFPPVSWEVQNPDNDWTWGRIPSVIGPIGAVTSASVIINYPHNVVGHEDAMLPYIMDISGFQNPILLFDMSHALRHQTLSPSLRVEVSTDCGDTFQPTGYDKSGNDLGTVPFGQGASYWVPTSASHWRTDTVPLAAFVGDEVQIKFVSVSAIAANNTYIDNVRVVEGITGLEDIGSLANLRAFPNPTTGVLHLDWKAEYGLNDIEVMDSKGMSLKRISPDANSGNIDLDLTNLSAGLYLIRLGFEEGAHVIKVNLK